MDAAPSSDVLTDPTQTWVQARARRTRACLVGTTLILAALLGSVGAALGIAKVASL
jgi:hypothetical protein